MWHFFFLLFRMNSFRFRFNQVFGSSFSPSFFFFFFFCVVYALYIVHLIKYKFQLFCGLFVDKRAPSKGLVLTTEVTEWGGERGGKERMNEKPKVTKKLYIQNKVTFFLLLFSPVKWKKGEGGRRATIFFIMKQRPKIAILGAPSFF